MYSLRINILFYAEVIFMNRYEIFCRIEHEDGVENGAELPADADYAARRLSVCKNAENLSRGTKKIMAESFLTAVRNTRMRIK